MNAPKYTRDQKRRAVQECVKRLSEFEATLRLIRQFDICEQDIIEYTSAQYVNGRKYTMSSDPALTTSSAYDPHTGRPIGKWAVEARTKPTPGTTFDQAVEEATELRTQAIAAALARYEQGTSNPYMNKDWVTLEELEDRNNQAALTRSLQGLVTTPAASLKSYTDWA